VLRRIVLQRWNESKATKVARKRVQMQLTSRSDEHLAVEEGVVILNTIKAAVQKIH
jgi:hypothetical protein